MATNTFRVFLTIFGQGEAEFNPDQTGIVFKVEQERDQVFYRRKLSSGLTFSDPTEVSTLVAIADDLNERCRNQFIRIERKCGNTYTDYWNGIWSMGSADVDLVNCEVTIKPDVDDAYTCLLDNADEAFNITSIVGSISVDLLADDIVVTPETFAECKDNSTVITTIINGTCSDYAGSNVISDFFQLNPENTSTINYVTGVTTTVDRLRWISQSNTINPSDPDPVENLTFAELMDIFRTMFNVYWAIDGNGNIRIEHYSYFYQAPTVTDLATLYPTITNNARRYSFTGKQSAGTEVFSCEEYRHEDFGGQRIYYRDASFTPLTCVDGTKTEEITVSKMVTDIDHLVLKPDEDRQEGWALLATYDNAGTDEIIQGTTILSGDNMNNEPLSWSRLLFDYHTHNRRSYEGWIIATFRTFDSSDYTKEQESFEIDGYCCTTSIDLLKVTPEEFTTQLGQGRVVSATEEMDKGGILKLELKYQ